MEDAARYHKKALEDLEIIELKKPSEAMERLLNERVEELLEANTEPVEPNRYVDPLVYYEPAEGTGGVPKAICTCGWSKTHYRFKVLQKAAIKHAEKTGHRLS
jgi:hypothetical protein